MVGWIFEQVAKVWVPLVLKSGFGVYFAVTNNFLADAYLVNLDISRYRVAVFLV